MERLRKRDEEKGIAARPVTDEQRAAIAEVRSLYDSKIAEQEILQQSTMNRLLGADPAELDVVTGQFRLERERLASERDAKVEKLRRGTD
jgi:hypothetical protein